MMTIWSVKFVANLLMLIPTVLIWQYLVHTAGPGDKREFITGRIMERRIDTATPAADHVLNLLNAAKITRIVIQACDLKLFDELQTSGPSTVGELAQRKDWEKDALRKLLDCMVAVKLLTKSTNDNGGELYENTEAGRLLLRDGPPALHEYAMAINDDVQSVQSLAKTIRKGRASEVDKPDGDEGELLMAYRMCHGMGAPFAHAVVRAVDLSSHYSCVDLGGGTGVFSTALLNAYPGMSVVLAEYPDSLPVLHKHFLTSIKDPRLSVLGLDFHKDSLPEADLYFLANVLHDHRPDKATNLLTSIHTALNTGGAILIVKQLMNDGRDGPPQAHVRDLATLGTGRSLTGRELAELLTQCGYGHIEIVKTQEGCVCDVIYARKL